MVYEGSQATRCSPSEMLECKVFFKNIHPIAKNRAPTVFAFYVPKNVKTIGIQIFFFLNRNISRATGRVHLDLSNKLDLIQYRDYIPKKVPLD